MADNKPRFKRRKLQTGILRYPADGPKLIDTRQMQHRHLALRGSFDYHQNLQSRFLAYPRTVMVYLPPSYHHSQQSYPVLYMQDGNNLFDPATGFMGREWRMDETLEKLFLQELLPELIVVGIYNSPGRFEEYSWHPQREHGHVYGVQGPAYACFLVEELKPFIDSQYRTLSDRFHTGIMGSSLGAMISFYAALAYPHTFSRVGLMSPTVYWAQHQILHDVAFLPRHLKIWVDIGSEEGSNPETEETIHSTQLLVQALESIGYSQPDSLGFYIDWLAGHDEHAWARRLAKPLRYLFG